MKRSKILKYITFLIIFTITITLNFSINISQYETSSSPNKHFIQLEMPKVEAANEQLIYSNNLRGYQKESCSGTGTHQGWHYCRYKFKVNGDILELWEIHDHYSDPRTGHNDTIIETFNLNDYKSLRYELTNFKSITSSRCSCGQCDFITHNNTRINVSTTSWVEYGNALIVKKSLPSNDDLLWVSSLSHSFNGACDRYFEVQIYADLKIYGELKNSDPTIALTSPSSNSPLLGRQASVRGVV